MKKGNASVSNVTLFSALAAILIAVPVRVYQYFKLISPETGFYDKTDFTVYLLYGVLAAAALIALGYTYLNHKKLTVVPIAKRSVGFFVVSVLMAIGAVVDSAMQLSNYFELFSAQVPSTYYSIEEYVQAQGGTILLIQAVFGGISAIYFFVTGISVGIGNTNSAKFKVFALAPVIWNIFRLLYRFKRTISFTNVSDLLLELFAIVFSMMFFLAFAQLSSKIDEDSIFRKIYAYGVPAAMFSLMCFLPRAITLAVGGSDMLNPLYGVNAADLAIAVFATYACIAGAKANAEAEK